MQPMQHSQTQRWQHRVLSQRAVRTVVAPQHNRVIALRSEIIAPQDGAEKQDCEINAAKRWLHHNLTRYQHLKPVYLGDDLYSRQPLCQTLIERDADFLLVAKPASHTTLYDYLRGLNLPSKTVTQRWPGNQTEKPGVINGLRTCRSMTAATHCK